jgi:hypothetical protein
VNHCVPWSKSRGEIVRTSDAAHGIRIVKTSNSQNSGLASRPAHAVSPASAAGRAGRWRQRTIELSNHVLMVASFGPHVYGLIVWVCTLASEGSEDSGLTPWSTG